MHKPWRTTLVISSVILLFCPVMLAQDSATPRPDIVEVMNSLDKNGMGQARVGIRTLPQSREEVSGVLQREEYPALSLFYSEGFKFVRIENCGAILRNDNTQLISHSKLVNDPSPGERVTAELFIPLNRLSITKGRKPFRHTSDPQKAQLLGTWRTEFKSSKSLEDVVLTVFNSAGTTKLGVWKGDTLTFTFDNKQTSEKFDTAFRQAIKICQPIKYLIR
ncbi:MAG TPA: hypothetical protein VJ784_12940 [Pyrinomonadaceae bacterium]|nr:hypothetical protein [Pyrinomonadaceae bacterium]